MMRKYLLSLLFIFPLFAGAKDFLFSPSEINALKQVLSNGNLQPGDQIILRDGLYENMQEVIFYAKGNMNDTITLKAEHDGKAIISGALSLKICGEFLQIRGLIFHKAWALYSGMIDFQKEKGKYASHCRLTQCVIDDCNNPNKSDHPIEGLNDSRNSENWIGLFGWNNRIDHCYFANKKVGGLVLQIWLSEDNVQNNHIVDYNLFSTRKLYGGNGAEIIRIGHSWSSQLDSHSVIENNVFFHCDGENEIISIKSCHNVIRRNLFYESRGGLVCRHGHFNRLESNTFVGNGLPETLGIRIINQGHTVYDNYLFRLKGFGLLVRVGVFERPTADTDIMLEPLTSYHRSENVDIAYNHFINCEVLEFGSGQGDKVPRNIRFAHNNIYNGIPNIKVFREDEVLPGIFFQDNEYHFTNGASVELMGFTERKPNIDLTEIEIKRVRESLISIGPLWYSSNNTDLMYIKSKDQKMQ